MQVNAIKTMFWGRVRCGYWSWHVNSSTLRNFKVEADTPDSSATSLLSYQNARCHIPELQVSDFSTLLGPTCTCRTLLVLHRASCWSSGEEGSWQRKNDQIFSVSVRNVHSDWMYCEQTECYTDRHKTAWSFGGEPRSSRAMPTAAMYSDRELS